MKTLFIDKMADSKAATANVAKGVRLFESVIRHSITAARLKFLET